MMFLGFSMLSPQNFQSATAFLLRRTLRYSPIARFSSLQQQRRLINSTSPINSSASRKGASGTMKVAKVAKDRTDTVKNSNADDRIINLNTVTQEELETLVQGWGHPKYRGKQIYGWIRQNGVTDPQDMTNIPKTLQEQLLQYTKQSSLQLAMEQTSKDGTIKRAYRCFDGQLIESVLMPYDDGRYTACISSQAGCAMGCVFCATGQGGLKRQLTSDEIFEQVSLFATQLQSQKQRLSNIVFMGMGEPLANYRNVKGAINRINNELGIGARKITVSTVGIVPNIRKLLTDPEMPQVRLAVSLHCATDEERDALIPANKRYGGLDELMSTLHEYITTSNRRITLEWALIENENDSIEVARKLGRLIQKYKIRPDMVHVNVIPLNPTSGYTGGRPSQRNRVNTFCKILEDEFRISCTPRVRRGIDIDAGCGQLKTRIEEETLEHDVKPSEEDSTASFSKQDFVMDQNAVDIDADDDWEDPEFQSEDDKAEAERLISLVKGTTIRIA